MKFTPCQLEVAEALAKGLTYAEAGRLLGLKPKSVQTHTARANDRIPSSFEPHVPAQRRLILYYREHVATRP